MGVLGRKLILGALLGASLAVVGCPPAPVAKKGPADPEIKTTEVRWRVTAARRETQFVRLDLPVLVAGTKIKIFSPRLMKQGSEESPSLDSTPDSAPLSTAPSTAPSGLLRNTLDGNDSVKWQGEIALYSARIVKALGGAEGPMVDQLMGQPRVSADGGSYLVPLPVTHDAANGSESWSFQITEPMPVYVKLGVPAAADPGEYRFLVRLEVPGSGAAAGHVEEAALAVDVSEVALPTEPRVLGIMTTTVEHLARIYPESFGAINGIYLDRADPDQKAAVDQLDALVREARRQGIALFVEDIAPNVKVNPMGLVSVDWDAYDRLMQPYMDGSAFAVPGESGLPMPVWLAPVPPRRVRDAPTQLWQYIDACAKHFAEKGWVATAAFLHPALVANAGGTDDNPPTAADEKLRQQVVDMLRLHMPRDMLAVTTPDAGGPTGAGAGADGGVPHGQLWVVEDGDARLPQAGGLGTEASIRVWPWMCVSRAGTPATPGTKGFVWRDAISSSDELGDGPRKPLLVVGKGATAAVEVMPSLRMAWLSEGMNDSAMLGLLEKRSDPALVSELLAGVVGRTGLTAAMKSASAAGETFWPIAEPGFLYAGWLGERATWQQVPGMLERLVLQNDPGRRATVNESDPLYLAAKLWLAQARRPVARTAGYAIGMRSGTQGDILDFRLELAAENPVAAAADFDVKFEGLPGDFETPPDPAAAADGLRRRTVAIGPSAAEEILLPLAGHVDSVIKMPDVERLDLTERHGGASLRMPLQLPIYRMKAIDPATGEAPPKLDGHGSDWPINAQVKVYGEMKAATRFLSRPDLINAEVRQEESAPAIRWTYDNNYIYMFARCPQETVTDDRNNTWPIKEGRWWGEDGLQVQLSELDNDARMYNVPGAAGVPGDAAPPQLVEIAFKPSGVMLVKTGALRPRPDGKAELAWVNGPPAGSNAALQYGIVIEKSDGRVIGYSVEAAIPRAWVTGNVAMHADPAVKAPAWRINVLCHRASDLASMSWSGPLVDDQDIGMMGVLVGE